MVTGSLATEHSLLAFGLDHRHAIRAAPYTVRYLPRDLPTFESLVDQPHTDHELLPPEPATLISVHEIPYLCQLVFR